jgi:hypothetical protein
LGILGYNYSDYNLPMSRFLISSICFIALNISVALADECHFHYWQVIPAEADCKVFYLPDFEFRPILKSSDPKEASERFCSQYDVSSKFGKQVVSYCFTGLGERTGPQFRLGDEGWNYSKPEKDRVFFADLNFVGCSHGKEVQGMLFGRDGWKKVPSEIERSWPSEGRMARCVGNQ